LVCERPASVVRRVLNDVAASADLRDAGQPITFTPHDFRRLFATELVSTGLPLHIAATLLGHLNLDTTRRYTAVFPEEVIAAHQHFIERRRATRPRSPSYGRPPARNGPSSRTTSCCARSPLTIGISLPRLAGGAHRANPEAVPLQFEARSARHAVLAGRLPPRP